MQKMRFLHFSKQSSDFRAGIETCLTKKNAVAIFDIDNTLMFPIGYKITKKNTLGYGNDFWFCAIAKQLKTNHQHASELWMMFIAHYYAIQPYLQYQLTDPAVPDSVRALQNNNIPIIGLTARGSSIAEITIRHLKQLGIDFSDAKLSASFPLAVPDTQQNQTVFFHNNIIFCNGVTKGKCLNAWFDTQVGKRFFSADHVLYMDDSATHCEDVGALLTEFGFKHKVIHYDHVEKNISRQTKYELQKDADLLKAETGLSFHIPS